MVPGRERCNGAGVGEGAGGVRKSSWAEEDEAGGRRPARTLPRRALAGPPKRGLRPPTMRFVQPAFFVRVRPSGAAFGPQDHQKLIRGAKPSLGEGSRPLGPRTKRKNISADVWGRGSGIKVLACLGSFRPSRGLGRPPGGPGASRLPLVPPCFLPPCPSAPLPSTYSFTDVWAAKPPLVAPPPPPAPCPPPVSLVGESSRWGMVGGLGPGARPRAETRAAAAETESGRQAFRGPGDPRGIVPHILRWDCCYYSDCAGSSLFSFSLLIPIITHTHSSHSDSLILRLRLTRTQTLAHTQTQSRSQSDHSDSLILRLTHTQTHSH